MDKTSIKTAVHISRHWHEPLIEVAIYKDGISIEIPIEDFCKAIAAEVSHPWKTLTRAGLEANILASLEQTLNKVKEASAYV